MLVINRAEKEAIYIGRNAEITIEILRIQGNKVVFALDAPEKITIDTKRYVSNTTMKDKYLKGGNE